MDLRQRIGAHDLKTPAGFPRGSAPGLIPALLRAAATSVVAPRRHRSTRSSPRTSRAGSSGVTRRSGPCRATSRRSSAAISSAASSASHFGRALCTGCGQGFVIAFITEPGPIRNILTHRGEPLEPPQISPARGDRLGFAVPGDMRVQEQGLPRQPACAAGAEALAEAEAAHAAANLAGVW